MHTAHRNCNLHYTKVSLCCNTGAGEGGRRVKDPAPGGEDRERERNTEDIKL